MTSRRKIRYRSYLSPRRWKRLGLRGAMLLPEVVQSYWLFKRSEPDPLPDAVQIMTSGRDLRPADPLDLVRATDWVLLPLYGTDRCMPRSMVLFRMLHRRGQDPTIVYGAIRREGGLAGHAWVLLDGAPLAEWEDPREKYAEVFRFEG